MIQEAHPGAFPEMMEVANKHHSEEEHRDAAEDYPQSGSEVQILCVCRDALGGQRTGAGSGGRAQRAEQQPGVVLGISTLLFWDRVGPEVEPFAPENLLVFGTGLLVCTPAPSCTCAPAR